MAHDVFISYSSKDKAVADAVCATLEARGLRCWLAPRDILPGKDWGESIIDAIDNCRAMVLVFSETANKSRQIMREVNHAVEKGATIVPLRIQDVMPTKAMEYYLDVTHWLDALTPPVEDHLQGLADKLELLLNQPAGEAEPRAGRREPSSARGISSWANRKLPLWVAAGILVAGVAIAVTFLAVRRARSGNSAARAEVQFFMDKWAQTMREKKVDELMSLYADNVMPYYGEANASKEKVRATLEAIFADPSPVYVQLDLLSVEIEPSGRGATVQYKNTYEWKAKGKTVKGQSHNEMTLSKFDKWYITAEKNIKDQLGGK